IQGGRSLITSAGTLTVANNVTLNGASGNGATLIVTTARTGINTAASSQIALTGTGVLNLANVGSGNTVRINLVAPDLVGGESYSITLATTAQAGGIHVNGSTVTGTIDPSNYQLGSSYFAFTGVSLVAGSTNLVLNFTTVAVPEPGIVLLIGASAF